MKSTTTAICLDTLERLRQCLQSLTPETSVLESMEALRLELNLKERFADETRWSQHSMLAANVTRRVLKIIRDEVAVAGKKEVSDQHNMATVTNENSDPDVVGGATDRFRSVSFASLLRDNVMDALDELALELESSSDEICEQAMEHIHANEVILTFGQSATVENFLKKAAKGRKFQVMVAENAPSFSGHSMASSLASTNTIEATVIPDSAMMAVMSRVNKVIIGADAILADGGLKASIGSYTVALAAKHYSVPLYVCVSLVKLTPEYYTSKNADFHTLASPEGQGLPASLNDAQVVAPLYEYVPPDLVTLLVDNIAGHAPAYVYRLLSELYHPDDYDLRI